MSTFRKVVAICCIASVSMGCATKPKPLAPVFYPADAEMARLQYLTRISRPEDIEKKQNAFLTFLIGPPPPKPGLSKPYGLALNNGKLYICDTVTRSIAIADLKNRAWSYFQPRNIVGFKAPVNLDVDELGNMYVADASIGQVMIFSSNHVYRGGIGAPGAMKPSDVKVRGGKVYVADLKSHSVRVYDAASKELLLSVPVEKDDDKKLFSPTNIDVDSEGNIYVSDTGAFRVQKYNSKGSHMKAFGGLGREYGKLVRNKGVAVDRDSRIYVADAATQVVQIFDKEGNLLLFFGEQGTERGVLYLPAGMIVDYEHNEYFEKYVDPRFELDFLVLVTSQYGPGGIGVYGMVTRKQ